MSNLIANLQGVIDWAKSIGEDDHPQKPENLLKAEQYVRDSLLPRLGSVVADKDALVKLVHGWEEEVRKSKRSPHFQVRIQGAKLKQSVAELRAALGMEEGE